MSQGLKKFDTARDYLEYLAREDLSPKQIRTTLESLQVNSNDF